MNWIEENNDYINSVICAFNPINKVIYIADDEVTSDTIEIFNVHVENKTVASNPIYSNEELYQLLDAVDFPERKQNIEIYNRKQQEKNRLSRRMADKIQREYKRRFYKVYVHDKEYELNS